MKTLIFVFLTILLWGSTPIIEKVGLKGGVNPFIAVFIRSSSIVAIMVFFILIMKKQNEIASLSFKTICLFSLSGIMAGFLGMWTYFKALESFEASRVVPLTATYPLVTTLLSVLLLGEHVTLTQLIGTILIVIGIWLVQ